MDSAEKIYEQYFTHARHNEESRLKLASIYAIIVVAVIAYFGKVENINPLYELLLIAFLVALSYTEYLICYALNVPFIIFSRLAEFIAIKEFKIEKDYRHIFASQSSRSEELLIAKPSLADIYMRAYELMFYFFSFFFLYKLIAHTLLGKDLSGIVTLNSNEYLIINPENETMFFFGLLIVPIVVIIYYIICLRKLKVEYREYITAFFENYEEKVKEFEEQDAPDK